MSNAIDKFKTRLAKAQIAKRVKEEATIEEQEAAVVTGEKVKAVADTVQEIAQTERKKSEATPIAEGASFEIDENVELKSLISRVQSSIKSASGKRFIAETAPRKNDGFIFDIVSNTVSVGKESSGCSEFIRSNENALYEVHPHSLVDFRLNETTSVRRAYFTSDLSLLGNTIDATLSGIERGASKFYYLPDNTDLFSNNIKQGFSGYTFVWRSVAAAYRYFNTSKASDIKVVDLFEHEPVQISIKAETSPKYGNATMFTRYKKNTLSKVRSLCYPKVAETFWRDFVANNNIKGLDIDSLRDSNLTYNLLNHGESFDLICNDKRFIVNASMAKIFLNAYLKQHSDALAQLAACVVYGEYLSFAGVANSFTVLKDSTMGEPLGEFKSRAKKGIPLWVETLPKLALGRVANKGRLGEYVLVDEGREVENLFSIIRIPCKEQLTLPAGHKEIRFPLTIGGSITDKSFIAKVMLEEELSRSTDFNVELRYNFDNEKSYEFVLSNQQLDNLKLTIEEGEPEKAYSQFKMDVAENDELVAEIFEELKKVESWLRQRRYERFVRPVKNEKPTERRWEFGTRAACNKIFSIWLGLPYEQKVEKVYHDAFMQKVRDTVNLVEYSQDTDNIDRCYNGLVHITLALLSTEIGYETRHYDYFVENRKGHSMLEHAVEAKVLCNPDIAVDNVEAIATNCKNLNFVRTFALPFLANEELLNYFCESRAEMLEAAVDFLVKYFQKLCKDIEKAKEIKFQMRVIRDTYEFVLGLLKLRGTEYWHLVERIEDALPHCVALESKLYDKLVGEAKQGNAKVKDFSGLVWAQDWTDKRGNALDADLLISRVTFKGDENYHALCMMHPLALTAITYLEGNPDIHIIGCGLKEDAI